MALLSTSYSNSQDISTTGNLVNFTDQATGTTSTWQNAGTIGQPLTCWAGGDPGYCGPLPRVGTSGAGSNTINFSYGLTDLYQVVNIKNALPNSGTGLQVNGFNFGFTAKNGNGWDNGMQDYLTAYVNIYNNTNSKVLESYNYNVNQQYNWTQFYWSETFNTPYAVPDLGNARYGLVGKDNNFWVGPYGPEVMNVNFSLKYSVDPCATNPLYSPSCKGYADALAKLAPVPASQPADAPPPPPLDENSPPPPPPGGNLPPPPGSNPPPGPGAPPPAGAGPAPVSTAKSSDSSNKAGPSLGTVLSMISSNQTRIGNETKAVVQAAEAAAAKDAQQAQEQAESVAATLTTQSQTETTGTGGNSTTTKSNSTQSQNSAIALVSATQTTVGKVETLKSGVFAQETTTTSQLPAGQIETLKGATPPVTTSDTVTVASAPATTIGPAPQSVTTTVETQVNTSVTESSRYELFTLRGPTNTVEAEIPQLEGIKIGSRSVLMDAIEQQPMVQQTGTQTQQTSSVNRNVQPNELAAGVDIASIAKQPAGYQSYSFALADALFYEPKEIYKNQVNVDNVKLLRGLGSDRLHQQMIDMQYK